MIFNIEIPDSYTNSNGVTCTQSQLMQGIAQVRDQHNQRTGQSLTDADWINLSVLESAVAWFVQGQNQPVVPPSNPQPNWINLRNRLLGGDLHPIFERLTIASMQPDGNPISTAKGDISDAILIVRIEAALASGLHLLTQVAGYVFTQEEKDLWNPAVEQEGFSDLVKI